MQSDTEISDDRLQYVVDGYKKYIEQKMPLEYIVGKVTFLGNDFVVSEHTLIPRPETEYMIEAINEYVLELQRHNVTELQSQNVDVLNPFVLLDVGTGCGVLGLSVLLHNPAVFGQAVLSDMSSDALQIAKKNYHLLTMNWKLHAERVDFVQGSLLEYVLDTVELGVQHSNKNDIIDISGKDIVLVANLPYIPDETFDANVDETVKKWEPRMAFVWGEDGLDLYRIMFEQIFRFQGSDTAAKRLVMFLEMMTWQIEILQAEFWAIMDFEEVKTFHFNIRIVKASLK